MSDSLTSDGDEDYDVPEGVETVIGKWGLQWMRHASLCSTVWAIPLFTLSVVLSWLPSNTSPSTWSLTDLMDTGPSSANSPPSVSSPLPTASRQSDLKLLSLGVPRGMDLEHGTHVFSLHALVQARFP